MPSVGNECNIRLPDATQRHHAEHGQLNSFDLGKSLKRYAGFGHITMQTDRLNFRVNKEPNEVKFRSTYEAHARALLGYALRRTATPADAADVVAETMLIAWRRFDIVPNEPETILWLYGVARNVISNGDRTRRRQLRLSEKLRAQLDEVLEDVPMPDPSLASQVARAMEALATVEREVLTLTATEQLSPAEIAVVLDMKQNTVRTHLHRARKKLRVALATDTSERSHRQ
ncbi:MAG: RNA polymerase sigma factor [Actinobacteria bacterium]|nr:RNA polymerase sigma factor [Actinomycetota bacterium]